MYGSMCTVWMIQKTKNVYHSFRIRTVCMERKALQFITNQSNLILFINSNPKIPKKNIKVQKPRAIKIQIQKSHTQKQI